MEPWPVNFCWSEREAPLPRCPSPWCRRSGQCQRLTVPWKDRLPCRRTHESQDEMYERLARKIGRFTAWVKRNRAPGAPDPEVEPGSPEFEERYAFLYNLIRNRVAEDEAAARAGAPRQKARRRRAFP